MRLASLALLLTIALPLTAGAQTSGLNLSWDECGSAGTCAKTFACNTNTGANFELVGSFRPSGLLEVDAADITLDVWAESGAVPNWWKFYKAGSCRQTAVSAASTFPGLSNCVDPWQDVASGGIVSYTSPYVGSSGRAQIGIQYSRPTSNRYTVTTGTEYYAFRLSITRAKTVGTGSCAGCFEPLGIVLSRVTLYRTAIPVRVQVLNTPVVLTTPGLQSNFVSWQNGGFQPAAGGAQLSCTAAVPVRNHTWGSIKALYR